MLYYYHRMENPTPPRRGTTRANGKGTLPPSDLAARPRAIGIVRVSYVGKRKGEHFVSPVEQEQRIRDWAAREQIEMLAIYQELDVSGGRPLAKRPGLRPAIERIEAGEASILVVAYFDRMVRSLRTQFELLDRVEAAGGKVATLDVGEVSERTSAQYLNATLHGMMAEYYRLQIGEKTQAAKAHAVARGVPPFPTVIPGYRRGDDGRLVVVPAEAEHVRRAFEMRASGRALFEIRDFLKAHGIERSYRSTQTLLRSRIVLGELHVGSLVNPTAHEPIVDELLWKRAQLTRLPRGPRSPSDRLLARLGVLRCATCDAAMGATYGYKIRGGKKYWKYHCGSKECPARAMISATSIEAAVVARLKQVLADESESASVDAQVADAEAQLAHAEAQLDAAVEAFAGIDITKTRERLLALQHGVTLAAQHLAELRAASTPARVISVTGNWEDLSVEAQRDLIRAVVARIVVRAGRTSPRFEIFLQ